MRSRSAARVLVLLAAGALLSAAGPAPRVRVIAIRSMAFAAAPADLRRGDVVVWANEDIFRHTATARDKSFDIDLPPKARVSMVLRRPGTFAFYCRFHPGMTGRLVVGS